jgi:glucose-1-phosphate adenylyltransferase
MPHFTLTFVFAIERGKPAPLTVHRTKAAMPFAGKYRVIDFTLANCLHSGLRQILVLTQYKSHSLHKHLRDAWSCSTPNSASSSPPYRRRCATVRAGTAACSMHCARIAI